MTALIGGTSDRHQLVTLRCPCIIKARSSSARRAQVTKYTPSLKISRRSLLNLDDTICYCFHVPKRKILNFIRIHKPRRASQISECGGAGSGCGWCVPYLKRYFEEARAGQVADPENVTPEEYARMRADYI